MFYQSIIASCLLGVVVITAFPIEMKDIQYLFPPQNTLLDVGSQTYQTEIDKQVGDSEEERKAEKACIPKQHTEPEVNSEGGGGVTDGTSGFEDNTPINGTVVEDPMEVRIYKPECDD